MLLTSAVTARAEQSDRDKVEFFEKKVRPILAGHCYACHSADTKPAGGLRVDDRNGMIGGGNKGPAVVPGKPEESLLLTRVTQEGKRRMPLEGEYLSAQEVADLTTWIKEGVAWPTLKMPASFGKPKPKYEKLKREHWAFRPLSDVGPPKVRDSGWPA
ncbi:c-type cytochrome domain-containing protein, partial [Singulisphaera rosea]